jgi:hypothetical protein
MAPARHRLPASTHQVLDEIGVDLSAALGAAPTRKAAPPQAAAAAAEPADGELQNLQARLAMLRG